MAISSGRAERILTLDVVRGIAVMGIFSVNVIGMAVIEPAYYNPRAAGLDTIADRILWAVNFVLVDHKMRSLFSMLFGASMLLVIERAAKSGISPARVHFARMIVLLLLGLLHFYLVWWGDVLTTYAVTGMIAFLFWRLDAKLLLMMSVLALAWDSAPRIMSAPAWQTTYEAAHAPGAGAAARAAWDKRRDFFEPAPEILASDAAAHRGIGAHIADTATERRWEPVQAIESMWLETLGMMLLGMAGFRSGFLTGQWSDRAYRRAALVGIGVGGAAFSVLAWLSLRSDLRLPEVVTGYFSYSRPFGPLMALGYAALIVLMFRRPGAIRDRFAAVGRAAFTNYLGTSLIGLAAFVGLGWYGQLSRFEAWLLVPMVWLLMLAWSKPWLDRFAYGPFEWLWRSLARWELQPMRRSSSLPA